MNKRDHQIYLLAQGWCESDILRLSLQECKAFEIHFISPFQLTHALGPTYWQEQKKVLDVCFALKKIYFWMEYFDTPGLAMGGLRLGVRHIIYKGQPKHFQKIKSLADFYQARVISSYQEISSVDVKSAVEQDLRNICKTYRRSRSFA